MQKIEDYIKRFFKSNKKNKNYTLSTDTVISFIEEMQNADGNGLYHNILVLFNYGYVKGYRAALTEMKKGGAA